MGDSTPHHRPGRGSRGAEEQGGVYAVRSPKTWEAMIAPARAEVIESLRSIGEGSIREIAAMTGRPAPTLYPHVRMLMKLGIVVERGERKTERRPERVYGLVAADFTPSFAQASPKALNRCAQRTAEGVLRSTERAFRAAAKAGALDMRDGHRDHALMHELLWLTPDDLEQVRALLRRLKAIATRRKKPGRGALYMATASIVPVVRRGAANPGSRTAQGRGGSAD